MAARVLGALVACCGVLIAGDGYREFGELRDRVWKLEKHKDSCDAYRRLAKLEREILFVGGAPLEAARARRVAEIEEARNKAKRDMPKGHMHL
jgi:hypothetical protein